jgi:hypothetical protein
MKEVLTHYQPQIDKSAILATLGLAPQGYGGQCPWEEISTAILTW